MQSLQVSGNHSEAFDLKPRGLASGAMAAKEPDVACFAPLEGAVDDGDRSHRIDGQLPHQQALPATVVAERRIGAARDDRGRCERPPGVPRIRKPESPRTAFPAGEEFPEHVKVVLAVETQCREIPALELLR